MSSRFSSPTLRFEHDVLRNCCRSTAAKVSQGGVDGATGLNHLAASGTLPRKATTCSRGRSTLVAEEVIIDI
jgi:hypothetical protein